MGLKEIQETIAGIDPLPGAREFLDQLRELTQVIILSDTFTQFGMPLMKKVAFTRNHGALGGQISYVLHHTNQTAAAAILSSANTLYGEKYIKKLLTHNPIKIAYRNIKHAIHKLFVEGI